ncbi:polypeptide N-acetylgalactosaminyltransferase 1 [Zeugodacus cucurbitae]|uniref:polypeptide N-acetylgalactosaminyltransferase 1 n=1 Tax=Zeugodacus cucurbitae TaxID=28588 RepID=UPI0023D94B8B|nr:polypeptide N-acetylgalactosaminyltransferase 1 [Zeugodacus cucurbitae]
MLRSLRSFYGKTIIFALVTLCFILYIKVLQVEDTIRETQIQNAKLKGLQEHNDVLPKEENFEHRARINPRHRAFDLPNNVEISEPKQIESTESIYELSIRMDLAKQDPALGALGTATHLSGEAARRGDEIYKKISLNQEISERLSYNRTLADSRHPACLRQTFDVTTLPSTSVIVIFYNEPYSVLVRTVHSTLNTCNGKLLKEIILVDDGSTNEELHGKLDYYISTRIPNGKVKVLRLKNRLGLIRARLAGARIATGDVLIFLDAHCEANIGWCEPLLQRIKESRTSVLVPIIDVIDSKDFQYSTNGYKSFQVGGFEWSGHFDWIEVSDREKKRQLRECNQPREICPAYSPTMAGGLFAIDRRYFWDSGSYDEQMDGWGGENLEMSFRIWQCGGTIETIPCSRVGHVFRDFHPYEFPNDRDTHGINTARMALVWMDSYVNLFFLNRPDLKFHPDIGDMTHRKLLRKKLRCKSFNWYLENIYPEKFVPTKNVLAYGRIRALSKDLCADDLSQNNEKPYNLGIFWCAKKLTKSQFFTLTNTQVLRNELSCATVPHSGGDVRVVKMVSCMDNDDYNEQWSYENEHLIHVNTGLCLDHMELRSSDEIQVARCDSDSETQRWTIQHDKLL